MNLKMTLKMHITNKNQFNINAVGHSNLQVLHVHCLHVDKCDTKNMKNKNNKTKHRSFNFTLNLFQISRNESSKTVTIDIHVPDIVKYMKHIL